MTDYKVHFKHADEVVDHLVSVIDKLDDPILMIKYGGFVCVAGVTVYELAIRNIFINFSSRKHREFGNYVTTYYRRQTGRIMINDLIGFHLNRFGDKYRNRFKEHIESENNLFEKSERREFKESYDNIIKWRHNFSHSGEYPPATFSDVIQAYEDGKEVIRCLDECMRN